MWVKAVAPNFYHHLNSSAYVQEFNPDVNEEAGHGLIEVDSSLVPFANKFPKNTKLYKLMTTKSEDSA